MNVYDADGEYQPDLDAEDPSELADLIGWRTPSPARSGHDMARLAEAAYLGVDPEDL